MSALDTKWPSCMGSNAEQDGSHLASVDYPSHAPSAPAAMVSDQALSTAQLYFSEMLWSHSPLAYTQQLLHHSQAISIGLQHRWLPPKHHSSSSTSRYQSTSVCVVCASLSQVHVQPKPVPNACKARFPNAKPDHTSAAAVILFFSIQTVLWSTCWAPGRRRRRTAGRRSSAPR